MTAISRPERGGTIRPSHRRIALVVSADPAVRADWARHFEALGMRSLRCVGPAVLCALADGLRCPLHEEADVAIYDRAALTPEFMLKLARVRRSLPVFIATDVLGTNGHHEPHVTAVASRGWRGHHPVDPSAEQVDR